MCSSDLDIVSHGKAEELMIEFARMMKKVSAAIDAAGYPVTQFITICNWTGFTYRQIESIGAVSKMLDMVSKFEAHYPETLYAAYFINCPKLFYWLLPLMKQCMSMKTLDKLGVYNTDSSAWLPDILQEVDTDNLFIEFGGVSEKPEEELNYK